MKEKSTVLWQQFAATGKIQDYLAYCSLKTGETDGNTQRKNNGRCLGDKGIERRGER